MIALLGSAKRNKPYKIRMVKRLASHRKWFSIFKPRYVWRRKSISWAIEGELGGHGHDHLGVVHVVGDGPLRRNRFCHPQPEVEFGREGGVERVGATLVDAVVGRLDVVEHQLAAKSWYLLALYSLTLPIWLTQIWVQTYGTPNLEMLPVRAYYAWLSLKQHT